ncbi:hypothetical protein GCM10009616_14510 [Microlunatus lacustris]
MLTHRDIQPWNLLAREGRPVVVHWELPGLLDLSAELGSTALGPAKGPGFDDLEPGRRPVGHTRWNILRCLSGVEAATGPDLALSHDSVHSGLRGLPDLFDRLPALEAVLLPP